MGSCVSVHKDHESAMKLRLSYGSKNDKLVSTGGDPTVADMALKSNPIYNVRDFDFIPSRGSTPVHHSSSVGNPVSVPVSSPADKKKKLSDLFKESLQVDRDLDEQHVVGNLNVDAAEVKAEVLSVDLPPKSADERPNVSGAIFAYTSERTLNVVFRPEDKSAKSCLPRLISSRSFSERRNRMSPSRSVG
ncbi:uncharacterized protein LOC111396910 isoform X2 [Olea europaea var. sylvestris]|uniref:uncharacterized protein LOC111396910 isoform X2 n=1 Tax=Olea europaea var. sylvestris TaxID=158386 RepID=UPI000C1D4F8F|nr:uncharacterized protein LOC111396910 isoform X2 [Olea europaea var. sylvestris]